MNTLKKNEQAPDSGDHPEKKVSPGIEYQASFETEASNQSTAAKIKATSNETNVAAIEATNLSEQTESAAEKLKKYQILHLDDDAIIHRTVRRISQGRISNYTPFDDADKLIEALEAADSPTIVICDNSFGDQRKGVDMAQITFNIRQEKHIPFVLMTGDENLSIKDLKDSGIINIYIKKPFTPQVLRDVLESLAK